jgi:hypothetical protein
MQEPPMILLHLQKAIAKSNPAAAENRIIAFLSSERARANSGEISAVRMRHGNGELPASLFITKEVS